MASQDSQLHTDPVQGRRVGIGIAVVSLLVVTTGTYVYVSAYGTGNPHSERAAALKAALHMQDKTNGTFWVAAYTPNAGAHEQSNTGHSCFGRTVEVRMVWKNANFSNAGLGDGPDHPKAAIVTADATSGTVCFVSAMYGPAAARLPTGSIYLYGPRKGLVPGPR